MADAYLKVKDNGANGLALFREESDVSVVDLKSALGEADSIIYNTVSLTWEHGGINLNTGETTDDSSTTRSRVIDYLDTAKLLSVKNNSSAVLWILYYDYSNSQYVFKSSQNVDPGTEYSFSTNHARYCRFDFRSSLANTADIILYSSNVKSELEDIANAKTRERLSDIDGILNLPLSDFFNGNLQLSGTSLSYGNYSKRTATRQGISYPLEEGDEIYLTDYTDAKFIPYWEIGGLYYVNSQWITTGKFTVTKKANYIILLANVTEKDQDGVFPLASLLVIRKNTLKTYAENLATNIKAALKPINTVLDGYLTQPKPLALFHFSDIHGDATETNRINSVYQPVVDECDDVLCTGDMVASRFANDASFIINKGFLLCIGNHDALADPTGWDWSQMATQQELYNKFFAPDIANWGVQYTPGLTYYYKDYTESNIRLIVLNNLLNTADMDVQKEWLTNILNDALTNNLAVVIAMHYHPINATKIDSNFTKIDTNPQSSTTSGGAIPYRVSQFIANGGEFICYLVGHEHSDYILNSSDYPNQITVCIDAASVSQSNAYSELSRDYGDNSQDLYNVCVLDRSTKTIKLIRIGCDMDNYMRSRKYFSIRYNNRQIVAQS